MKIVSWNCSGGSYGGLNVEKFKEIWRFRPDILLIQGCTKNEYDLVSYNNECIYRDALGPPNIYGNVDYDRHHWYGDNNEKNTNGIAIFSSIIGFFTIELIDNFNKEFGYFVPYKIENELSKIFWEEDEYILLSIWKNQPSYNSQDYQKTIF
jgi:hypothetical protein